MLLFVIGLPGRLADWCTQVTRHLAEPALYPTTVIRGDSLGEVALGLIRGGTVRAVVCSTGPDCPLRVALAESGRGFIVAVDDPRQAIADLALGEGLAFPEAVRRVASSCAVVSVVLPSPAALAFAGGRNRHDPYEIAAGIASHLGLGLSETGLAELLGEMPGFEPSPGGLDGEEWWSGLPAEQRLVAEGAIGPYFQEEAAIETTGIAWAPELFFSGEGFDEPLHGPVDMTGLPRCLMHGPEILVPPGRWSLSVAMSASPEAVGHVISVEVSGCEPVQQHLIRLPHSGEFEGTTEIVVPESGDRALAIRFSSVRAAFDGTLSLIGARLTPYAR